MHQAGRFELLNVAEVDGRWHYTFSGAGEVFSVVWPETDKQTETRVREEKGAHGLVSAPQTEHTRARVRRLLLIGMD